MPVNTAALKTFAPAMRRQLLEAVGRKLDLLLNSQTPDTLSTYAKQIAELREQEAENRDQLLERVAYTWFNRLCALRYLDAQGWHPFGCKVLMPAAEGETQPELLKLMRAGSLPAELKPHTNEARLHGLLDGQIPPAIAGADPQGEVYRELVLASCRSYHQLLPELFEGLDDASELLLPDDLLSEGSIAGAFRSSISDEDCEEVEIIGWLYQFYISEKKDDVMARKKAVPTEDIPAVTQLFTPHWIVRYLVENSLGRLWLRSRPNSRLREHMPYYVEDPDRQTPTESLTVVVAEEIKLLDPACGSGHMLTYAFDLLVKIYEEEGYTPSEIPEKILTHNLFGLEICPRAAQLAQFALVCKAREQSRTAFRRPVAPQVMCLRNVVLTPDEMQAWSIATGLKLGADDLAQLQQFRENTESFGALIQPVLDGEQLAALAARIGAQAPAGDILVQNTHRKLRLVLDQAEMLSQRYQVVVANPPYSGSRYMNSILSKFAKSIFPDSKTDLFSMFIERAVSLLKDHGTISVVCPYVWMYLAAYEKFRSKLVARGAIHSLVRLEYNAFEPACVPVAAWVYDVSGDQESSGTFIDLSAFRGHKTQAPRTLQAIQQPSVEYRYSFKTSDARVIPGSPIAYQASKVFRETFKAEKTLGNVVEFTGSQNVTGDNARFVRLFWEVPASDVGRGRRWVTYAKGGGQRKWYGFNSTVVDWGEAARRFFNNNPTSNLISEKFCFREGITYSELTSSANTFRLLSATGAYDKKGPAFHPGDEWAKELLLLCNSAYARKVFGILNPTLSLQVHDVKKLPLADGASLNRERVGELFAELVPLARADWDNFETSWDFSDLPLLRPGDWEVEPGRAEGAWKGRNLAESWANYSSYCAAAIRRMQELETENNRLWNDAYGLQDELDPAVPEEEITLARAAARKDLAAFLSYATGCMMGRYSLDQPGLILADSRDSQAEQLAAYEENVGKPLSEVQFKPDPDGIIPVLDGEWFEDDIVSRTREFLAVTFPESNVAENLRFIEESLGKDIRKYFCSDFYKDHLQTYKKRPIYWMVQSPAGPSRGGFACLIYLHRYTKDTLNQVLNNYFRPYLQKLEARLAQLGLDQLNDDLPTRERTAARKEAEKITKVLKECQAWEQDALLPLAQQRIELDLDDGVKVNYLKLQDVLAPIPGLAAKED
jgi:hypothetical protein